MSCYEIEGGRPLEGRLRIQGAKNSVLPILAAAVLAPGTSVIRNCPRLSDVDVTLDILRVLGCRAGREGHTVTVDASGLNNHTVPEELSRAMRSSVIFLGVLLARLGQARLSSPGGCRLGPRPIDLHISALKALGAQIDENPDALECRSGGGMRGRTLYLPMPSVGATENIMLAACGCPGVTTLVGAAREPEIVDLQNFLRAMGAQVSGAGSGTIVIEGGHPLHGAEYTVMGDRIAAATCLCATAAAGGRVELEGLSPDTLTAVLTCLEKAGCTLWRGETRVGLENRAPLRGIGRVRTEPFPGFPTDAQAILMAALAGGTGITEFEETIFDSRYHHVEQLRRMGADITVSGRVARVNGKGRLCGADVCGADLRGGAALMVAGLAAEGVTRVSGLCYIRRGYEMPEQALKKLGAQICLRS